MKRKYIEPKAWVDYMELSLLNSASMFDRTEQSEIGVHTDEGLDPSQAMSRRSLWEEE